MVFLTPNAGFQQGSPERFERIGLCVRGVALVDFIPAILNAIFQ